MKKWLSRHWQSLALIIGFYIGLLLFVGGITVFGFESNTGKTHIEIIGTSAVPEFDSISGLVLVVSLISVVAVGTRLGRIVEH